MLLLSASLASAAEIGEAGREFTLADPVSGMQRLPVSAYAGGVYLVAWQEGHYGWGPPADTDIRGVLVPEAGRVAGAGSFVISAAPDFQERPAIATDGDLFLVVWQDLRNGKDYDVYAARVTRQGKLLDPAGIEVAKAPNNQCSPAVSFDGKNFVVVWMDDRELVQSYQIRAARVSVKGELLDPAGAVVASFDAKKLGSLLEAGVFTGISSNANPRIACRAGECLVGWLQKTTENLDQPRYLYLATASGLAPVGKIFTMAKNPATDPGYGDRARNVSLSVAGNDKGYLSLYSGTQGKGNKEYFIAGTGFAGGDKEPVPVAVKPLKAGYKLSESVASWRDGFAAVWAEGDRQDVNKPVRFTLRAAALNGGDPVKVQEIVPWQEPYLGAPFVTFGAGRALLVYEAGDPKNGMRIVGRELKTRDGTP